WEHRGYARPRTADPPQFGSHPSHISGLAETLDRAVPLNALGSYQSACVAVSRDCRPGHRLGWLVSLARSLPELLLLFLPDLPSGCRERKQCANRSRHFRRVATPVTPIATSKSQKPASPNRA